jgi:hypothetical protein
MKPGIWRNCIGNMYRTSTQFLIKRFGTKILLAIQVLGWVADKSKIDSWIPDLHKDSELKYSYILYKKASNAIEDVVIVFYDTDFLWTDKDNQVVRKETRKFTHTWKKLDGKWLILGGMAAMKDQ